MTAHKLLSTTCSMASLASGRYFEAHRRCVGRVCACRCHTPPPSAVPVSTTHTGTSAGAGGPETGSGAGRSSTLSDAAEPSSPAGSTS